MDELQLIGYTADLKYLVFCDADQGGSRYKASVDEDLLATLSEVVQLLDPDHHELFAQGRASAGGNPGNGPATADASPVRRPPGEGTLAAVAALVGRAAATDNGEDVPAAVPPPRSSQLAPREIQSLLRAGKTPKAVAKQAGTDEAWVRRWLAPIEAERGRVVAAAQRGRLSKARLGESRDVLGDAVVKNLRAKGVNPADESVEWTATRAARQQVWTVALRYRSRGRAQQAVWRFDPETGVLEAANPLATQVGWTGAKKAGAKKAGAKKAGARKVGAKKATAQRSRPKKGAAKKGAAKTVAAKSGAAKNGATKKVAAKKTAAKKAAAKKAGAKKAGASKRTSKAPGRASRTH